MVMTTDVFDARDRFLTALRDALDLHVRLLHSTEAHATVVAREHDAITDILDRLGRHPQQPHIQKYSLMNEHEFYRAESEYLERFRSELSERSRSIRVILDMSDSERTEPHSLDELSELMRATVKSGAPNQFSEAHSSTITRIRDPRAYYGSRVGEAVFSAASEPKDLEHSARDETGAQLLRVKAEVVADRVRHHTAVQPLAVGMALVKAKEWLQLQAPIIRTPLDARPFSEGSDLPEGIIVFSPNARSLMFGLRSPSSARALYHWGLDNSGVRLAVPVATLPPINTPSVTVVLFAPGGAFAGSGYVLAADGSERPLDALAMLAKKLDFATEYLTLAAAGSATTATASTGQEPDVNLLIIAEEL